MSEEANYEQLKGEYEALRAESKAVAEQVEIHPDNPELRRK